MTKSKNRVVDLSRKAKKVQFDLIQKEEIKKVQFDLIQKEEIKKVQFDLIQKEEIKIIKSNAIPTIVEDSHQRKLNALPNRQMREVSEFEKAVAKFLFSGQ